MDTLENFSTMWGINITLGDTISILEDFSAVKGCHPVLWENILSSILWNNFSTVGIPSVDWRISVLWGVSTLLSGIR